MPVYQCIECKWQWKDSNFAAGVQADGCPRCTSKIMDKVYSYGTHNGKTRKHNVRQCSFNDGTHRFHCYTPDRKIYISKQWIVSIYTCVSCGVRRSIDDSGGLWECVSDDEWKKVEPSYYWS